MKQLYLALILLLLAGAAHAQALYTETMSVTSTVSNIVVHNNVSTVILRENSASPSAIVTITPSAPGSAGVVLSAGQEYKFQSSGQYQVGQVLGTISSTAAGPFTFVLLESQGAERVTHNFNGGTVTHSLGSLTTGEPVIVSGAGDIFGSPAYLYASQFSGSDGCAQILAATTQSVTNGLGQSVVIDLTGNQGCAANPINSSFSGNIYSYSNATFWLETSASTWVVPTKTVLSLGGGGSGGAAFVLEACNASDANSPHSGLQTYCGYTGTPVNFPSETPIFALISASRTATALGFNSQVWGATADCNGIVGCVTQMNYYAQENSGYFFVTGQRWGNNGRCIDVGRSTGTGSGGNTLFYGVNCVNSQVMNQCQAGAVAVFINGGNGSGAVPKGVDGITVDGALCGQIDTNNGWDDYPDYDVEIVGQDISLPLQNHEESSRVAKVMVGGVTTGLGGAVTVTTSGGALSNCSVADAGINFARSGTYSFTAMSTASSNGSVNVTFSGGSITGCSVNVAGSGYGASSTVLVSIDDTVTVSGAQGVVLGPVSSCCSDPAGSVDVVRIPSGANVKGFKAVAITSAGTDLNLVNDQNHTAVPASGHTVEDYELDDQGNVQVDTSGVNTVIDEGSRNVKGTLQQNGSSVETVAAAQAAFSGIGGCTNQVVTTLTANGAPTCATLTGSMFTAFQAHTFFGNNSASSAAPSASPLGTSDTSTNWYAADTGSVNAYVVTLSPAMSTLTTGVIGCFKASAANTTTTPTVAFNGLAATTIKKSNFALSSGDISTTVPSCVVYDGTNFELMNPQSNVGSGKNVYSAGPSFSGVVTLTGLMVGSNTQRLTADTSSITATTAATGTAVFSWGALPSSTNFSFICSGTYTQLTAAGGVSIAVQGATNAPTKLDAWATMDSTNPASTTYTGTKSGTYGLATTTATNVATVTPGAIATQYQWTLNGSIQVGASATNLNIIFYSGSSSDAVVVKEGSFCTLTP